eukprot:TRINITY_DN13227_c0_g1_i1.p1 TRINITY_DN13227_c0_g1~~TRINITY_DN13227_c0_g1_i1.p1  ORF type:complete len:498 (+),score=36.55 TRINITY_DN13227_c0_g1_i1:196-1494(+)
MEVTTNLPLKDWYRQTADNDLQWWGLDYPPVTAFHSWICGKLSSLYEPESMELFTSRGYETPSHRQFMRMTVIASEVLVYFTGLLYYLTSVHKKRENVAFLFFFMLSQPALLIIDHGHFQYNSVALGFVLWALGFLSNGHDLLGSIAYTLALNYKQMSLYFAPAFFFYLLGKSYKGTSITQGTFKVIKIGLVVIATMAACWAPFFIENGTQGLLDVVTRIFPAHRGLYEDKVANFWCSVAPIIKFKELFPVSTLIVACAATTLIMMSPSCIYLLMNPTFDNLLITVTISSMSFFLFSFHVHEKSILFPILGVMLLIPRFPRFSIWMIMVSVFSMFPLIVLDQSVTAYYSLLAFYYILTKYTLNLRRSIYMQICYAIMALIHVCFKTIQPPAHLPFLLVILFTTFAFCNFVGGFLFLMYTQTMGSSPKKVKAN